MATLLAGALAIGLWYIAVGHPAYHDLEWIFFERGNQLYRAGVILDGGRLYRDVAFQYGPLAAQLHAAWSALAGISITTTLAWHLFWSLVGIALGYRVFRRMAEPWPSAVYSALLWVPLMLEPGGLVRMINAEHQTLDRIWLLVILLLWSPPAERTAARSLGIGAAMAAWQWTKFGGAVFAGAAMVLVDLAFLLTGDRSAAAWKRWISGLMAILATVLLGEGLLAAWCLSWATVAETWDIVLPLYMSKAYDVVLTSRWPGWHGPFHFLQFQFLPLLALLLGVAAWLRSSPQRRRDHAVAWISAGFYLLGVGTYIRVEANFYLYAFALAPLAVAGLVSLAEFPRRIATVLLLIPFAILVRSAATPWAAPPGQAAPDRAYALPGGDSLWLTPANAERLARLEDVVREVHALPGERVVLAWLGYEWEGGGFLHYYEPRYPLPNFFASPGTVRPSDVDAIRAALPRAGALVLYAPGGTLELARKRFGRFLPPDLVEEVMDGFERDDVHSSRWFVVLRPKKR